MIVLALESAVNTASVAILKDDVLVYENYLSIGLKHSEVLLLLVDDAFKATGITPNLVDLYAITTGPGSFTGLRVGISLIKGLALPFKTLCTGVSTLQALAQECILDGIVLASVDARRGDVYYALFEKTQSGLVRLTDDICEAGSKAVETAKQFNKPIILIGDGSKTCYTSVEDTAGLQTYPPCQVYGKASAVAVVGQQIYNENQAVDASLLTPVYLKLSQAEQERLNKISIKN